MTEPRWLTLARNRLRAWLIDDWSRVLRRAWSIRLILLAALLSGVEVALPILDAVIEFPRGWFAAASAFVTMAALVARIIAQKDS